MLHKTVNKGQDHSWNVALLNRCIKRSSSHAEERSRTWVLATSRVQLRLYYL